MSLQLRTLKKMQKSLILKNNLCQAFIFTCWDSSIKRVAKDLCIKLCEVLKNKTTRRCYLTFVKKKWRCCLMRFLPSGEQMRKADMYTIEEIGIPSLVLMERAALGVVDVLIREAVELSNILIVCGAGNNGGDGFAVGRILYQKGYKVELYFIGGSKESYISKECKKQMDICINLGMVIHTGNSPDMFSKKYSAIIDAIFGVGLTRLLSKEYCSILDRINKMQGHKIAIDIPSGVCSSTGQIQGNVLKADLTIAIQCEKRGTVLFPGSAYAGKVKCVDIGIVVDVFFTDDYKKKVCFTYEPKDVPKLMPRRTPNSHKGTYGKVLMITGSQGMSGAAYLSGKGAYAVGAGLVKIYTSMDNKEIIQGQLPEAVVAAYEETSVDLSELSKLLKWADIVCIGCGLGQSEASREVFSYTLSNISSPVVIDADGVNMLRDHKNLLENLKHPCVLTPHMKEMANLLDITVDELVEKPIKNLTEFVEKYPVTCVLKDARTFVNRKGSRIFINTSGNNAMAKAGSGDVLAGFVTGLAAGGLDVYESSCLGVYLHGLAGDAAKESLGSYSVLASDIVDGISKVLSGIITV